MVSKGAKQGAHLGTFQISFNRRILKVIRI